jgi:uncharacterized repeat protein (TIGR01451 family)
LNITDPDTQCAGFYPLDGPTNNLADDLFSDNQPIRRTKEAVKDFVRRLRPDTDQVGFVYYNGTASKGSELMCRRRYGVDCYSGTSAWGWPGGLKPYTDTVVLNAVEDQFATSQTCTACGMRAGLEELGINVDNRPGVDNKCDGSFDSACAYGAARRMMILLTDGVPNASPGGGCDDDPDLWPDGGAAHDCGIYYAQKAGEAGVVIYVISLGNGVDIPWLQAIADETKGQFYQTSSPNDLDLVFDFILSSTGTACYAPKLILTKSVAPGQGLGPGDILTYSLSFSNTGDLASADVVLTDRLPLNTRFITASGVFTPPAPVPGDVIRWDFSGVMGGMTGTQHLALVISPTQPGQMLTNVAGMSGRSIYGYYISAQALLTTSFGLPPGDGSHLYLPIILKW